MRRRAAGCAGEPPKLSLAATAALESSCSLAAAVDDPTTPGCSFRVFGGRMGGGVGFAGPLPENMSHISHDTIGQKINNYCELFHFVFSTLCREVDKIFQMRVRFLHSLEENRKQTTTILCLLQQRHIQEDWKLQRF